MKSAKEMKKIATVYTPTEKWVETELAPQIENNAMRGLTSITVLIEKQCPWELVSEVYYYLTNKGYLVIITSNKIHISWN